MALSARLPPERTPNGFESFEDERFFKGGSREKPGNGERRRGEALGKLGRMWYLSWVEWYEGVS